MRNSALSSSLGCLLLLLALASVRASVCDYTVTTTTSFSSNVQTLVDSDFSGSRVVVCLSGNYNYSGCTTPISMETGGGGDVTLVGSDGAYVDCSGAGDYAFTATAATDSVISNITFNVPDGFMSLSNSAATLVLNSVNVHGSSVPAVDVTAAASVDFVDSVFSHNDITLEGGCLLASSSVAVTVVNSLFSNNYADDEDGGVILLTGGGSVDLLNSTFNDNSARGRGGVVCAKTVPASVNVDNCEFNGNVVIGGDGGCVFVGDGSTGTITDSTFNASGADSSGGVGAAEGGSSLHVERCFVFDSYAIGGGSGSFAAEASALSIVDSVFVNNSASYGPAAYIADAGASLVFHNCIAEGNSASGSGAVILVEADTTANVSNSVFRNNYASQHAGAIRMYNAHVNITSCTFEDNKATFSGGALLVTVGGSVFASDCSFERNIAGFESTFGLREGGAVLVDGGNDITFANCVFDSNTATSFCGGALSIRTADSMNLTNCAVTNNVADWEGGGMRVTSTPEVVVSGSVFDGNSVVDENGFALSVSLGTNVLLSTSTFSNNIGPATYAGTIYLESGDDVVIDGCTVSNNIGEGDNDNMGIYSRFTTTTIRNSVVSDHSSANECPALDLSSDTVNLTNVVVSGAVTPTSNPICVTSTVGSTIDGMTAMHNSGYYSGALYTTGGPVTLTNSNFHDNTATYFGSNGGGVYLTSDTVINNVAASSNSADGYGGGIAVVGAVLTIGPGGLRVDNNTARVNGGGLYCHDCGGSDLSNIVAYHNTASTAGGVYSGNSSPVTMNNATITSNTALYQAGGVMSRRSSVTTTLNITTSTITCNQCTEGSLYGSNAGVSAYAGAVVSFDDGAGTTVANNYLVDSSGEIVSFTSYPEDVLANVRSYSGGTNGVILGYVAVPYADQDPRVCLGVTLCDSLPEPNSNCVNGGTCANPNPYTDFYGDIGCNCTASPGAYHSANCSACDSPCAVTETSSSTSSTTSMGTTSDSLTSASSSSSTTTDGMVTSSPVVTTSTVDDDGGNDSGAARTGEFSAAAVALVVAHVVLGALA